MDVCIHVALLTFDGTVMMLGAQSIIVFIKVPKFCFDYCRVLSVVVLIRVILMYLAYVFVLH